VEHEKFEKAKSILEQHPDLRLDGINGDGFTPLDLVSGLYFIFESLFSPPSSINFQICSVCLVSLAALMACLLCFVPTARYQHLLFKCCFFAADTNSINQTNKKGGTYHSLISLSFLDVYGL